MKWKASIFYIEYIVAPGKKAQMVVWLRLVILTEKYRAAQEKILPEDGFDERKESTEACRRTFSISSLSFDIKNFKSDILFIEGSPLNVTSYSTNFFCEKSSIQQISPKDNVLASSFI